MVGEITVVGEISTSIIDLPFALRNGLEKMNMITLNRLSLGEIMIEVLCRQ